MKRNIQVSVADTTAATAGAFVTRGHYCSNVASFVNVLHLSGGDVRIGGNGCVT